METIGPAASRTPDRGLPKTGERRLQVRTPPLQARAGVGLFQRPLGRFRHSRPPGRHPGHPRSLRTAPQAEAEALHEVPPQLSPSVDGPPRFMYRARCSPLEAGRLSP
jgi:hypothetical protein